MPAKIDCAPLSLEHQDILSPLWKKLCSTYNLQYAEYSFANAFLFRNKHHYHYVASNPPSVQGEFQPKHSYIIPTCLPEQIDFDQLALHAGISICFFPIAEEWLPTFEKDLSLSISFNRADSDYLFTKDKLKSLSGRALSSRRNLLHQLQAQHTMESYTLDGDTISSARQVLEAWQQQSTLPKEETDYYSCLDALQYFERLNLCGRIAYADGQPVGFSVGELLTPQTALMHIAKSLHSIKGLTPYLYQDFAQHLPETVSMINLEQDLGIPSLRQAKEAYDPDLILPKWRVCRKC